MLGMNASPGDIEAPKSMENLLGTLGIMDNSCLVADRLKHFWSAWPENQWVRMILKKSLLCPFFFIIIL